MSWFDVHLEIHIARSEFLCPTKNGKLFQFENSFTPLFDTESESIEKFQLHRRGFRWEINQYLNSAYDSPINTVYIFWRHNNGAGTGNSCARAIIMKIVTPMNTVKLKVLRTIPEKPLETEITQTIVFLSKKYLLIAVQKFLFANCLTKSFQNYLSYSWVCVSVSFSLVSAWIQEGNP